TAEQLDISELNPASLSPAEEDQIVDNLTKTTRGQPIQLYRVIKKGNLSHQGEWLTAYHVKKQFPQLMGHLNAMGTIASEGGRNDPGSNSSGATSRDHNFCTVPPIDSVQKATESLECVECDEK
ncbi:hypothetical protein KI387_010928, partial [Taxus chinensis]